MNKPTFNKVYRTFLGYHPQDLKKKRVATDTLYYDNTLKYRTEQG